MEAAARIELAYDGFANHCFEIATSSKSSNYKKITSDMSGPLTGSDDTTSYSDVTEIGLMAFPDLAEIASVWGRLPEHVRIGVTAMIRAAVAQMM